MENNMDYDQGMDYDELHNVQSGEECKLKCDVLDNCLGFAYDPNVSACFYKDAIIRQVAQPTIQFYYRDCNKTMTT